MKLNKLIFLLCLMGSTSLAFAQKPELVPTEKKPKQFLEYYIGEYKFKERNNWFLFGFGPTFYPNIPSITNANFSVDFNYFDKKNRMWNAGYTAISQEYLALGAATIYLHELKFSRGLYRVEKQYFKMAAFVGPSIDYAAYYPRDTTKSIAGTRSYGIGIQAKADFIYKPVYDFGIAISPFINVNTIQTVAGITISVYSSNAMVKSYAKSKER